MKLITKEIRAALPKLYANDGRPAESVKVPLKLFAPWSRWTWYITEFDGTDRMFGLVDGFHCELDYISLSELAAITGPGGIKIERDIHWNPETTLAECYKIAWARR